MATSSTASSTPPAPKAGPLEQPHVEAAPNAVESVLPTPENEPPQQPPSPIIRPAQPTLNLRDHLPPDAHFHDETRELWSVDLDRMLLNRTRQLTFSRLFHRFRRSPLNPRIPIFYQAVAHSPHRREVFLIKLMQSTTKETEDTLKRVSESLFYIVRGRTNRVDDDNAMAELIGDGDHAVEIVAELVALFNEQLATGEVTLHGFNRTCVVVLWRFLEVGVFNYFRHKERMLERRYGVVHLRREVVALCVGVGWVLGRIGSHWIMGIAA